MMFLTSWDFYFDSLDNKMKCQNVEVSWGKKSKMLLVPHLLTQACGCRCDVGRARGVEGGGEAEELLFDELKRSLIPIPWSDPTPPFPRAQSVGPAASTKVGRLTVCYHITLRLFFFALNYVGTHQIWIHIYTSGTMCWGFKKWLYKWWDSHSDPDQKR